MEIKSFGKGTRRGLVGGLAAIAALTLAACGSSGGGSTASTSAPAPTSSGAPAPTSSGGGSVNGDGKLLKVFMPSTSNVYLEAAAQAAKDEAAALGFEISVVENQWDPTEQDSQVQEWIATGESAAAILFWPTSAANATASIRALSEVAPVLQWNQMIDPAAEEFIAIGYAGVSDYGIGAQTGQDTLDKITELTGAGYKFKGGDKPNVIQIQLGTGDYAAGVDRTKGYTDVAGSAINLLATEGSPLSDGFTSEGGYKAASIVIPKYLSKGIDIIAVQTNDMANGVVQAAEQAGLVPGKDVFIITGTSSGSMANLKAGKINSAVLQSPVIEGTLIVDVAAAFLATGNKSAGGEVTIASDKDKPAVTATPPARTSFMMNPSVTTANVGAFMIWGWDFNQLMGKAATE